MTAEESNVFWKLNAFLKHVQEDMANDPEVLESKACYNQLKAKMLDELTKEREEDSSSEPLDAKTALEKLDAVISFAISLASAIPQLAGNPEAAKLISESKSASKWLHENIDSLKIAEKPKFETT